MDSRSLKFVADACAGKLSGGVPETPVGRVCSDSRQAQAGDLFFALKGDRFDGHDFLAEVARRGVAAVVAGRSRIPPALPCPVIAVDDPRLALGRLAARYRADFTLPVTAVCGSNGKTTTKELIAAILRRQFNTLWSEASFNNDIGVPLTLLKLSAAHQAAVLEAGTNHPGELAPLLMMIRPRLGVLTGIGREHLEFFGDLAGVAAEQAALAEALPVGGTLFINGDDEFSAPIARRTRARVVRAGFGTGNDWRATKIALDFEGARFQVETATPGFSGGYRIQLAGRHQVGNAVLALAVGAELKVAPEQARAGLAECPSPKMRLQIWNWNGVNVLDDAYNANADSVGASLHTLRELPCGGRRVVVLGDMAELGVHTLAAHEEAGRLAAELGIDQLFAVGALAAATVAAARQAGLRAAAEFSDVDMGAAELRKYLRAGDTLLLKASRAARLERIGEALKAGPAPAETI